jgi:hypothetical protein
MKGINWTAVSTVTYFCKIWERTILCHTLYVQIQRVLALTRKTFAVSLTAVLPEYLLSVNLYQYFPCCDTTAHHNCLTHRVWAIHFVTHKNATHLSTSNDSQETFII